ncbi:hypothetical protein PR048_020065 [Dryococelus australis]|uniref:CCHC-type domain-containing protein n=1 Tax=Dryococelus australis TaxID=614101 RepID=A0ABQ9H593_9NEOP|nr:hypothetical protein PR048_020065 [Dryococelus australis]
MFLTLIGGSGVVLPSSLVTPKELIECSYEELIKALDTHFDPNKNEVAACFVFANRRQLSRGCNFQDFKKPIQFFCCIGYERLQHQLLSEMYLTLNKALLRQLTKTLSINSEVKQVTGGTAREVQGCEYMSFQIENKFKPENSKSAVLVKCYRCGASGHKAPVCRHKATVCSQCDKVGHLKRVCRITTVNKVSHVEICSMNKISIELEKLGMAKEHYKQLHNVNTRGHPTQPYRIKHEFEVDAEAALTIVNCIVFENIWPNVRDRHKLAPSNASLAVWHGKRVQVYGQVSE